MKLKIKAPHAVLFAAIIDAAIIDTLWKGIIMIYDTPRESKGKRRIKW